MDSDGDDDADDDAADDDAADDDAGPVFVVWLDLSWRLDR